MAARMPTKEVMQALVTVGALVALADGHLETSASQGVTRPPARAASQVQPRMSCDDDHASKESNLAAERNRKRRSEV